MVNTCCFVPYCRSKSEQRQTGKKISTFGVPKNNENLYQLWKRKLPREGFQKTNRVCEKHFVESDIVRYNELPLKDGSVYRAKLDCPYLKPDAVPRIFPNLPSYLSTEKKTRKPPKERVLIIRPSPINKKSNISNAMPTSSSSDSNSFDSEQPHQYDHLILSQDLERAKTNWPHWFWNDVQYQGEEMIFFGCIGKIGFPDRFVRVKKADLSVKAFFTFLSKPISNLPVEVLSCQTDIFEVLKFVNDLKHCPGPGPELIDELCICKKMRDSCQGDLHVTSRYRQRTRCAPCQKLRDHLNRKKKNETKKSIEYEERLYTDNSQTKNHITEEEKNKCY